jgi:hypothetical protein
MISSETSYLEMMKSSAVLIIYLFDFFDEDGTMCDPHLE